MSLRDAAAHGRQLADQETPRRLDQEAGAVTGAAVGGARAAMHHAANSLEREAHDFMGCGVRKIGDETDATGVVLACRSLVKTARARMCKFRL